MFSAVRTRLELATYGVTGRYSNQLNYRTFAFGNKLALTDRRAVIGATCASALRLECHCVSTLIGCYAAQQSDISGDFCCKMCLDRCLLFKSA